MQQAPNLIAAASQATAFLSDDDVASALPNPVIILSAPRSGSTLLFEQLTKYKDFWSIGGESHAIFRFFPKLRAENVNLDSMALDETHADPATCSALRRCFLYLLRSDQGTPYLALPPAERPPHVCLLEKTPRNALSIPFLLKVFPRARFIFLHRDSKQTVSSLIEAWSIGLQTGRFVTFRDLPNWHLPAWCFLLPKGWRALTGKTIAEIAAFQWSASNSAIIEGLTPLDKKRYLTISYQDFIDAPANTLCHIAKSFHLNMAGTAQPLGALPFSRTTVTPPSAEKWRRHEQEIQALWPILSKTQAQIDTFCKQP